MRSVARLWKLTRSAPIAAGPLRSFSLKGRNPLADALEQLPRDADGWVTVDLSDPLTPDQEMDQRIKEAKEWQAMALSPEDAEEFDKSLDLEEDLLEAEGVAGDRPKAKKRSNMSPLNAAQVKARSLRGFLQLNPSICSGCGASFQTKVESNPGFLPPDKFVEHHAQAELIRKKQKAIKILEMADMDLDSSMAAEYLTNANMPQEVIDGLHIIGRQLRAANNTGKIDIDEMAGRGLKESVCICQRCHRLQAYGQVDAALRPGWSENDLLTPQRFEDLLSNIKDTKSVVLSIVDIFDLEGSILRNLRSIAGNNPVVIAANKADLLPGDVSELRIISTIYDEVMTRCGFMSPAEFNERPRWGRDVGYGKLSRADVQLISCQGGYGIDRLMDHVNQLAQEHGRTIHVLGAANAGKSSFINRLLEPKVSNLGKQGRKRSTTPLVTVSNLPGTTLDFLKIKLPNGVTVIDTPGLIRRGHITSKLTTDELKQIIPIKPIKPITLRVEEGKVVLIGGFAKVELTAGRPMFLTFFTSSAIKLHLTSSLKADEYIQKHIGELIFPPASLERLQAIGPMEKTVVDVNGSGWDKSDCDIVLPGIGWVAVTGPGECKITVTAPKQTVVSLRPALLPYEAKYSTASYTGMRMNIKSGKRGVKPGRWSSSPPVK